MNVLVRVVRQRSALTLCALALIAIPLEAQRILQMTTADAATKARVVVVARVLNVSVRNEGGIFTYVDFQTLQNVKGEVADKFTYRVIGGRIGDTEVSGGDEMPKFTVGEEVVLFLGPEVAAGGYPTLLRQHVYRVSTSRAGVKTISPAPTGLDLAAARPGPVSTSGPARLDDFVTALQRIK